MTGRAIRGATFARSSAADHAQRSIEERLRPYREHACRQDWTVIEGFTHGTPRGGPVAGMGLAALLEHIGERDILLAESMDRICRCEADVSAVCNRIEAANCRPVVAPDATIDSTQGREPADKSMATSNHGPRAAQ